MTAASPLSTLNSCSSSTESRLQVPADMQHDFLLTSADFVHVHIVSGDMQGNEFTCSAATCMHTKRQLPADIALRPIVLHLLFTFAMPSRMTSAA